MADKYSSLDVRSLLDDYAFMPDILTDPQFKDKLGAIKKELTEFSILRDLRDGQWSNTIRKIFESEPSSIPKGQEVLFSFLKTNGKFIPFKPALTKEPIQPEDWCAEALQTNIVNSLTGIIVSPVVKIKFQNDNKVENIENIKSLEIGSFSCWNEKNDTKLYKTTDDFLKAIGKILEHSTSISFIDPNIDPTKFNYKEFKDLLSKIPMRKSIKIRIHRIRRSGNSDLTNTEWEKRFSCLNHILKIARLSVRVIIWDTWNIPIEHNRYLITNLIGISAPYGFDVLPGKMDTWHRMDEILRASIQQIFDPGSKEGNFCFRVGKK